MKHCTLVLLAAAALAWTPAARGQCGGWSLPTGLVGPATCMTIWDDGSGAAVYCGGRLSLAGGGRVVRWNGSTTTQLGGTFSQSVTDLAVHDDGSGEKLYVSGLFLGAGGVPTQSVLSWNGSAWIPAGAGLFRVLDLLVYDVGAGPQLFAGGYNGLSVWNGTQWILLGAPGGPASPSYVQTIVGHDDGSGPAVYVGGNLQSMGGVLVSSLGRWQGGTWSPVGSGLNGWVFDLAVEDLGSGAQLYACGAFTMPVQYVAMWDGSAWSSMSGPVLGPTVLRLAGFDDGNGTKLYASGQFATPSPLIARWNGASWSGVAGGVSGSTGFLLGAFDDGHGVRGLYLTGDLTSLPGGTPAQGFARWDGCAFVPFCAGDGSASACPCGNTGAPGSGCASSSHGTGAQLSIAGVASVEADTVAMSVVGLAGGTTVIFLQSTAHANGGAGVPFGDGILCLDGTLVRLATRTASAGAAALGHGIAGDPLVHARGRVPAEGAVRHYQAYYRDIGAFCTPSTFNLTNAVRAIWLP